jgi:tight adherence protein C
MEPAGLLLYGLVAAAVVAALASLRAIGRRDSEEVLERVDRIARSAAVVPSGVGSTGPGGWFSRLGALVSPKADSEEMSRIVAKLSHAGIRGPNAMQMFFATKLLLAVFLAGGAVIFSKLRVEPIRNLQLLATVLAAVGFYAPNVWLARRVTRIQTELTRSLPDALDLITTCIEAGLGMEAALQRISFEIGLAAPRLADELEQTLAEVQAGIRRSEAFQRLAVRTGVEDLRTLAAILTQTEMFGTSVAGALRVNAEALRVRRTHSAEEKAAKVAVKMLLPLIFFLLPSLLIVILGPAVLRIMKTLLPSLGGGN